MLLVLQTALIGVFVALDLVLFYFFWEATLIPMALLIGIYGHGRRIYAAVKFFLYTMVASMFMLAAILWLYAKTGTFDFVGIQAAIRSGQVENFSGAAMWLFLGFFIAFAVKVPVFPFHTWLPDAHVEAPTAGSVILAGIRVSVTIAIGTATIGSTVGALTLGTPIFDGLVANKLPFVIEGAVLVALFAILTDMLFGRLERWLRPVAG